MTIVGCLDGYGGVDAILPSADYIKLCESFSNGPSLPLYRSLGLGCRIWGGYRVNTNPNHRRVLVPHARLTGFLHAYFFVGFMLTTSFIWAPYWVAPHMLTESTRRVIPLTVTTIGDFLCFGVSRLVALNLTISTRPFP
jgi:hypothetical protein